MIPETVLGLAKQGVTIKEAMAFTDTKYKAAAHHFRNLTRDGLLEKLGDTYTTTDEGLKELAAKVAELPDAVIPVEVEIGSKYQIVPIDKWTPVMDEWSSIDREEAIEYVTKHLAELYKLVTYCAVAMGDLSQLQKLPRQEDN